MRILKSNFMLLSLFCMNSFAQSSYYQEPSVRPVLTLGALAAFIPNLASTTSFPITNPIEDSFYDYVDTSATTTLAGGTLFIGADWTINPLLSLQGGIDYIKTSAITIRGNVTQGADIPSENTYVYDYQILTQQFLLEGKLLVNFLQVYHPYVLAGLGVAYNQSRDFNVNVPPYLTYTREYHTNTVANFSYAIGAGLDINLLCDSLLLGLSYRYAGLGETKFENPTIDDIKVDGTLSKDDLNFNEFILQLSWVF